MKLHIEKLAWDKMMAFTDLCPDEISGLGKVEVRAGELVVTDVAIFEQRVSSAHSTITMESLAKFQQERVSGGESMKQWCFWWHSHANMSVFFSTTDTSTIDSSTEFPWLVSLVTNKKHELKARLDLFTPVRVFVDLEVEVLQEDNPEVKALCQAEITAKVTTPTHHQYSPYKSWQEREKEEKKGDYETEYWQHRLWLKDQVEYLRTNSHTKKQKKRLAALEQQLREHLSWGRVMGLEPQLDGMRHTRELLPPLPKDQ